MKKIIVILQTVCFSITAQTNQTYFLGHSLVNNDMPNMVNKLSIAGTQTFSYNVGVINGANLNWQWTHPADASPTPFTTLSTIGYENFIVTEAVPLLNHTTWSYTYRNADSLYRYAKISNPNIQYYLYETWHCNTTGLTGGCAYDNDDGLLWRPRLTADLSKWEAIADSINLIHNKDMLIIPAGQALAELYDSISANKVSGITNFTQLFQDDIHLTNVGNYFIACVMYGVIHKTSPVGLPNQLTNYWGVPYSEFPTTTQAAIFQRIAWRTLCNYSRDGVNCAITTNIKSENVSIINIIPNPTTDLFSIQLNSNDKQLLEIVDMTGKTVYHNFIENGKATIDGHHFNNGIYTIKLSNNDGTINKRLVILK